MGLEYRLECVDCGLVSHYIEFSIVRAYKVKNLPDDLESLERDWVKFIADHSGHRIKLVDIMGNESKPSEINGGYVVGLQSFEEMNKEKMGGK